MEDAATAEISRAQLWQWIRSAQGSLDDGRKVDVPMFRQVLREELEKVKSSVGAERYDKGRFPEASELFDKITTDEQFVEFLTLPGYERLN